MKTYWLLLSFLIAQPCLALEVLGVVGPVTPAAPYYEKLWSKGQLDKPIQSKVPDAVRPKAWSGDFEYDSELKQGRFMAYPLPESQTKRIVQPLCLVADDAESKLWLDRFEVILKEISAVCYLVKSTPKQNLSQLRGRFSDLKIFALDPTFLITTFGVPHYPALISKRGVEQ